MEERKFRIYSYLFGLFGTDGWIRYNNLGKPKQIEIELIDKDILNKIEKELNTCNQRERLRDTNFKNNYHSYILECRDNKLIEWLISNGFPTEDKTNNISTPNFDYDEPSFWRGIIDGDGSIGMKNVINQPFVNLTTKSENLKESFCDLIECLTNFRPKINRNKRDNIYNITLHGEKALKILNYIYQNNDIYLDRKYNIFLEIKDWKKLPTQKGVPRKKWTEEEVNYLINHTNEEFIVKYPNRTPLAVRTKRQKLKKEGIISE